MELSPHEKKAVEKYVSAINPHRSAEDMINDCRSCLVNLAQYICSNDMKKRTDSEEYRYAVTTVENNFFGTYNQSSRMWSWKTQINSKVHPQWKFLRQLRNTEEYAPTDFGLDNEARQCKDAINVIMKWYFDNHRKYQLNSITNLDSTQKKTIEHLFIGKINIPEKKETQIIEQEQKGKPIPEEKGKSIFKKQDESIGGGGKVKPNRNVLLLFGSLIIIALAVAAYLLVKSNEKPQEGVIIVPVNPEDSIKPESPNNKPATEIVTNKPPKGNESPAQDGTSKYIRKGELKNKGDSNKMAVLIINNDNSINGDIGQKIASVFLKNNGYNNTTSLLSKQFVTDGLFENIFAGAGIDYSKNKFSDFADYFCLGKLNIETGQSDVRNDMTKATISLEIRVVKTTNGGVITDLTIPTPYNVGAGFSKKEAIDVATENIINYLKKYKYEN